MPIECSQCEANLEPGAPKCAPVAVTWASGASSNPWGPGAKRMYCYNTRERWITETNLPAKYVTIGSGEWIIYNVIWQSTTMEGCISAITVGKCLVGQIIFNVSHSVSHRTQQGGVLKRSFENKENGHPPRLSTDKQRQLYSMEKVKETRKTKFNTTASTYVANFEDIEVRGLQEILLNSSRLDTVCECQWSGSFWSFSTIHEKRRVDRWPFFIRNRACIAILRTICFGYFIGNWADPRRTSRGWSAKTMQICWLGVCLKEKRCIIQIFTNDTPCCAELRGHFDIALKSHLTEK